MRRHERPSGRVELRICKTPTLRHIALARDYLHEAAHIFVLYTLSISPGFNDFIWRGAVRASARAAAAQVLCQQVLCQQVLCQQVLCQQGLCQRVLCQQVLRRPEPLESVRLTRAAPKGPSTSATAARADPD